jgi:hypothetical protein
MKPNYKENLEKINHLFKNKAKSFNFEDYRADFSESLGGLLLDFYKLDTEFYSTELNFRENLVNVEKNSSNKETSSEIDFYDMAMNNFDSEFYDFVLSRIEPWLDDADAFFDEGFENLENKMNEEDIHNKNELLESMKTMRKELIDKGIIERDVPWIGEKNKINSDLNSIEKLQESVLEAESDVSFAEQERDEYEFNKEDEIDDENDEEYVRLNELVIDAEKNKETLENDLNDYFSDMESEISDMKDDLDKITESREEFYSFINCTLADIKDCFDDLLGILYSNNEDFVNTKAMSYVKYSKDSDLESFVKRMELMEDLSVEMIINNKGIKLNNLLWFDDGSIVFLDDEKKAFINKNDSKKDIVEFCNFSIEHELRKIPKWIPVFKNYFEDHCELKGSDFSDIINAIEDLKRFNNLFKQEGVEPFKAFKDKRTSEVKNKMTFKNLERFTDELDSFKKKSAVNKMINTVFTGKYKKLLNEKSYEHLEAWYDNGFDEKILKKEFAGKLAAFEDSLSLNDAFRKITNNLLGWGFLNYEAKVNKLGAEIISKGEDSLIVKIPDYKTSKELGSQSWCISRNESLFDSYTSHHDQYFIYDFKRSPEDSESLIGITLNSQKGSFRTSHLKNDKFSSAAQQSRWISEVLINEKNFDVDFFIGAIKNFSEINPDGLLSFFNENKSTLVNLDLKTRQLDEILPLLPEGFDKLMLAKDKKVNNRGVNSFKM